MRATTIVKIMLTFVVEFGNVTRLKKLEKEPSKAIWYSGKDTVSVIDIDNHVLLRKLTNVIDAVESEPFGYFDLFNTNMLVVSTYGKDKKMFYLHDIDLDHRVLTRKFYNDQFFSKDRIKYTDSFRSRMGGLLVL